MDNVRNDLEYYLERDPTNDEVVEAADWMQDNPGVNLVEYVDAMVEIGAL